MNLGVSYVHMLKLIYSHFLKKPIIAVYEDCPFMVNKFVFKYSNGGKLLKK